MGKLRVDVVLVGFRGQDLLDLCEKRDMVVQHLMYRLKGQLDDILNVRPLMLLLWGSISVQGYLEKLLNYGGVIRVVFQACI